MQTPRRMRVHGLTRAIGTLAVLVVGLSSSVWAQSPNNGASNRRKLDNELKTRAAWGSSTRHSRLIVQLESDQQLPPALKPYQKGNRLDLINGFVLDVPDTAINAVAAQAAVKSLHFDRPIWAADYLSVQSTAADVVHQALGFTGLGIGVAVIDSGVTSWHDDLTVNVGPFKNYPYGNQRVSKFVDFVGSHNQPYDDHGHGSHVAGIILGNGYDSHGKQTGMAPDASLLALKVLDQDGKGTISQIIAALDWVVANARTHNIRVVNVSAGAGVTESYWTDPLTLATKRVVDAGIVVVAAAGNLGKNANGEEQFGGILCPANAPWVLTVGASSTEGTVRRQDDVRASFSSNGPTRGDYLAKPDLLAPGYGILSLAVPASTLSSKYSQFLVDGSRKTAFPPYLSLSGTSMAAPQVAGAVALMLQANPRLTPNLVKAILQYTAQSDADYNALEQGAGFMDALSAVRLARFYARNSPGSTMPVQPTWSRHLIWGTHLISGGYLNPKGNAWSLSTVWGANALLNDDNIVWGTACGDCDNIVWGTHDADGDNIVWGTVGGGDDNIVWGTVGGDDDNIVWGTSVGDDDNIVWGTSVGDDDNIVWGTACGGDDCDNIVWGTHDSDDNIVWGTADLDDNIVWGTAGDDNIVWGTAVGDDDNIVWGTFGDDDNIVWGTVGGDDNIVWGTTGDDNIVWGTSSDDDNIVWGTVDVDAVLWGRGGRFNFPMKRER